jgi:hypothetical protein
MSDTSKEEMEAETYDDTMPSPLPTADENENSAVMCESDHDEAGAVDDTSDRKPEAPPNPTPQKPAAIPVYRLNDRVIFSDAARISGEKQTNQCPAERTTVESSINFGIEQSRRTIHEAMLYMRTDTWKDWSMDARDRRWRFAGKMHLTL